ncbi:MULTISPECIES: DUF2933 domain-containing protein [Pseudofrankia]|uniref:DUF2933 domain-containing protein n=1 Tax=Pseudofrankia TaxID=2994363 RepID=UPI000234BBF8|nr:MULTISPECIES: DUF2933 domain-containing protein [Pseudofrankia]OHV30155.1 hypothetical protein BCD49_34390 [Pseudofrankia sp. EUN1h]
MTRKNLPSLALALVVAAVVAVLTVNLPAGVLLPLLLVLACPLTMFFMHGEHGMHGGGGSHQHRDTPGPSSHQPSSPHSEASKPTRDAPSGETRRI